MHVEIAAAVEPAGVAPADVHLDDGARLGALRDGPRNHRVAQPRALVELFSRQTRALQLLRRGELGVVQERVHKSSRLEPRRARATDVVAMK